MISKGAALGYSFLMSRTEKLVLFSLLFFLLLGSFALWKKRENSRVSLQPVPLNESERLERHWKAEESAQILDLNRASAEDFEKLPGIGPGLAQKIIQRRTARGLYQSSRDLMRVPGFGSKRYERLKENFSVNGSTGTSVDKSLKPARKRDRRPDLNLATAKQLEALPFVGPVLSKKIVECRERRGPFREKLDLLRVPGISISQYKKIAPRVSVSGPPP